MQDRMQVIIRLGIFHVLIVLFTVAQNASAMTRAHIVHFPSDRSIGTLYILDANRVDTENSVDEEFLCEAKGDINVPADKGLKLRLSKKTGDDLSPFSALKPDDLMILYFNRVEIDDNQLRHISHLTGLRKIDLGGTNILGTGLKHLAELKSLKTLWLSGTHVGDNELAYLSNMTSLKSLGLRGTPTTDAGMVHVGKMASLKSLSLSAGVGDEGLYHLKNLRNLSWLNVANQGITDEGIAHLAGLTKMETLYLRDTQISDAGLVYLKNMTKLKMLSLTGTRITEKGLTQLQGLENLEQLEVLFGVTETGLASLSKLPSLKNILVDGDALSEEGIRLLSTFRSLEYIYIDNTGKMDAIVKELVNLPGLKKLTLGKGLTNEGLIQLKNIQSLQELTIGPSQITGKGIAALAAIPSLLELHIFQAKLDSENDWEALGKLSTLQCLRLRHTRSEVTDAHVAHLTGLQSLKELSIDAIIIKDRKVISLLNVTDEGLGYISNLKSLEHLTLRGAKITDEGLQQLSDIPGLKRIDLQNCNVTEQGLQQLKKKLPALSWYL